GTGLDLPDTLLGDAKLAAELLEGLLGVAADPVAADQDPALPVAELAEHSSDDLLAADEVILLLIDVAAVVVGGLEHLLMAGDESVPAVLLLGDRPGEVPHDRPARVGAELETPARVELLDGADQRHVAVGDQFEKVVRRPGILLGDRDDQAEVGPDDLVLEGQRLRLQPLDLIKLRRRVMAGLERFSELVRPTLQIIHLKEEMSFLLA